MLAQLGNRVQHALRAFTPTDQKAVQAAAETFRPNPEFSTETAITELAVGEALVSMLEPGGAPGIVDRAKICPPTSRIGTVTPRRTPGNPGREPGRGEVRPAGGSRVRL